MAQYPNHPHRIHNPLALASQQAQQQQQLATTSSHSLPHPQQPGHTHAHLHPRPHSHQHIHQHTHHTHMHGQPAVGGIVGYGAGVMPGHHHHFVPGPAAAPGTAGPLTQSAAGGQGRSRRHQENVWPSKLAKQIELESLPSADQAMYYTGNSPDIDLPPLVSRPQGNRNRKLERGARFLRKGKMYGWSPSWEEAVTQKRVKKRLREALKLVMPASAADLGLPFDPRELEPQDDKDSTASSPTSTDLADSLDPPLTAEDVAPSLALPVPTTYLDLALSPAMKYTFGQAFKEKALMRTVGDLIEGEMGLLNVLGELKQDVHVTLQTEVDAMEAERVAKSFKKYEEEQRSDEEGTDDEAGKDEMPTSSERDEPHQPNGDLADAEMKDRSAVSPAEEDVKPSVAKDHASAAPFTKLAQDSTILLHGEPFYVPPGSAVTYERANPTDEDEDVVDVYPEVELTPLQKLFVTTEGLIATINPPPGDPRASLPPNHPQYLGPQKVRLTAETQKLSVIAALEKVKELTSDCNEYVKRLEEIRERISNLGRARRKVWNVVRERAITTNDGQLADGEADPETIRKRLEQEAGSGMETRRRKVAAGAGTGG